MSLLELDHVCASYGNIMALREISLIVNQGEIITLIGSNGAGKSSIMKTIMGLLRCRSGTITLNGKNITNIETRKIVKAGVILSPEGRQVFPRFSVKDNLMMGGYLRTDAENKETMDQVFQILPKLKIRSSQLAGTLSGGEQQMLAIGRALMANPKILLLDEPSLGIAPIIIKEIMEMITHIRELGTTILMVEQNAKIALKNSDRAYVIENGKIVISDTADALLRSDEVRKAYFGGI